MQSVNDATTKDFVSKEKVNNKRRKRINRMKLVIVIVVTMLMILPTIGCILLGIQVSRLQKQVEILSNINNEYTLTESITGEHIAYAAEVPDAVNEELNMDPKSILYEQIEGTLTNNNSDGQTEDEAAVSEEPTDSTDIVQESTQPNQMVDGSDMDKNQENTLDNAEDNHSENSNTNSQDVDDDNDEKVENSLDRNEKSDQYAGKKVYLTFDDGPSKYTDDILDILKEYQIKATFFVVGKTDKRSKGLYQRIVDEGHTLGMHSYSHIYKNIYNSVEDFDKDFTKLWKLLYDTTGYKPSIFRFPGGSNNPVNKNGMEDFIKYLNDASIVYYDWNVLNGDATGITYTKEQLIDNVLGGVAIKKTSIVLLHDAQDKEKTVESLPELLDALISGGAEILPLDKDVKPIQMIKANSID